MNRSSPGHPVYHQLPESTQTHVRRVSDAIQPSNPLLSPLYLHPIPPASKSFPISQLFAWGGQSIGVSISASVLPMNTQDRSPSKLWRLEITLMSLVSYHVALLILCTGQTVAYMNKVMNWSDPATVSKAMATWVCEYAYMITENLRQASLPNIVFAVLMSWICFLNLSVSLNSLFSSALYFLPAVSVSVKSQS